MPLPEYPIPSATKLVCLTETEMMALQFPTPKKVTPKKWTPIDGERLLPVSRLPEGYFISDHGRLLHQYQKKSGRIVKTELRGTIMNGYKTALITSGARGKVPVRIARIMLEAFRPHSRSNYRQAVALDGNTMNTMLDNWEWMTLKKANVYRRNTGEKKPRLKTKEVMGRYGKFTQRVFYSDMDIAEMERLILAGITLQKIAEIFRCNSSYPNVVKKNLLKRLRNGGS